MRKTITAVTYLAAGARGPEQVGADLALLERSDEDAVRPPPREVGLVHREGQRSRILTVERQDIEGVELDFLVLPT